MALSLTAVPYSAAALATAIAAELVADYMPLAGDVTGGNAAAGKIGEFISANVAAASPVALTSGAAANVTSISLTAGDWDVEGTVAFLMGATTTVTQFGGGVSSVTATLPPISTGARFTNLCASFAPGAVSMMYPTGALRVSISSTTTIYLVAFSVFGVSTVGGFGYIGARRVR
jgi:hypothetical protein